MVLEKYEDLIKRLDALPDVDITNPEVLCAFKARMSEGIEKEIREQESLTTRVGGLYRIVR